jgi:RNA-binding motif X-linked protein 2
VADYKPPKDSDKMDEETRKLHAEGCAASHGTLPIKHEEGESVEIEYVSVWTVMITEA